MGAAKLFEAEKKAIQMMYENLIIEMQRESDAGAVGDMAWMTDRLNVSRNYLQERILYPFREELEGEIISYPSASGSRWRVNKKKFNDWITDNFGRIKW